MPKTIPLSVPIDGPNGVKITSVTLRDPIYADLFDLGAPSTFVYVKGGGGGFEQVTDSVVQSWIERLYDGDSNFLHFLALRDALALREAVLDFFREATATPKQEKQSTPSPDSSSSAST